MSLKQVFLRRLRVRRVPGVRWHGKLLAPGLVLPCAVGRCGLTRAKREGDGATPCGAFPLLRLYRRPGRHRLARTGLPRAAIRPGLGWCDAAGHRLYNRPVRLPFAASHEEMWRGDGLYDLVLDIGWNRGPIRPGRGSAIFMHLATPGFGPTAGCVALRPADLARLLGRIGPRTVIDIR